MQFLLFVILLVLFIWVASFVLKEHLRFKAVYLACAAAVLILVIWFSFSRNYQRFDAPLVMVLAIAAIVLSVIFSMRRYK